MYAGTGISTDSARRSKAKAMARWTAAKTRLLFVSKPMPELAYPTWAPRARTAPRLIQLTAQPSAD